MSARRWQRDVTKVYTVTNTNTHAMDLYNHRNAYIYKSKLQVSILGIWLASFPDQVHVLTNDEFQPMMGVIDQ